MCVVSLALLMLIRREGVDEPRLLLLYLLLLLPLLKLKPTLMMRGHRRCLIIEVFCALRSGVDLDNLHTYGNCQSIRRHTDNLDCN